MKTKVLVWVKITCVIVESSKTFIAGVKKSRPNDVYITPRDFVRVEKL